MAEEVAEVEIIIAEIEEATSVALEEIDIIMDEVADVSEDIVDITDVVNDSVASVNEDIFSEMMQEDTILSEEITTEVSSSVDSMVTGMEEESAEIAMSAGSRMSRLRALWNSGISIATKVTDVLGRVLIVYMAIDIIGRYVVALVQKLKRKDQPTLEDEKNLNELKMLQDVIGKLKPIFSGWQASLKTLYDSKVSYGLITFQNHDVEVLNVVNYLITDAVQQMENASEICKTVTADCVKQLSDKVFNVFCDAQALIDLRDNKENIVKDDQLELFDFPPKDGDSEVTDALNNFPDWKDKVKKNGLQLAKTVAGSAVAAYTKTHVSLEINRTIRNTINPKIKEAGAEAGKKAAKDYMASQKQTLILKSLIPIFGDQLAREYGEIVKKKAIQLAKDAAIKAGKEKAKELQPELKASIKIITMETVNQNQDRIKTIGKKAVERVTQSFTPTVPNTQA